MPAQWARASRMHSSRVEEVHADHGVLDAVGDFRYGQTGGVCAENGIFLPSTVPARCCAKWSVPANSDAKPEKASTTTRSSRLTTGRAAGLAGLQNRQRFILSVSRGERHLSPLFIHMQTLPAEQAAAISAMSAPATKDLSPAPVMIRQ